MGFSSLDTHVVGQAYELWGQIGWFVVILVLSLYTWVALSIWSHLGEFQPLHRQYGLDKQLSASFRHLNEIMCKALTPITLFYFASFQTLSAQLWVITCSVNKGFFRVEFGHLLLLKRFYFVLLGQTVLTKNNRPRQSFISPSHLVKNCVKFLSASVSPLSPCLDSLGLTSQTWRSL